MRSDVKSAIDKTPQHVQDQMEQACKETLDLLDQHLPKEETVEWINTAAPSAHRAPVVLNCLLVLTSRRLLFIAPAPQVLSWRLPSISRVQVLNGAPRSPVTFFVNDFQLGADPNWSNDFEAQIKIAIARATLADM